MRIRIIQDDNDLNMYHVHKKSFFGSWKQIYGPCDFDRAISYATYKTSRFLEITAWANVDRKRYVIYRFHTGYQNEYAFGDGSRNMLVDEFFTSFDDAYGRMIEYINSVHGKIVYDSKMV